MNRIVFSVLARHLSLVALARDLAVLAALGLLASFSTLFVSRVPFDNFTYEWSLVYQSQSSGQLSGDLVISSYGDFELGNKSQSGAGRSGRSVNATAEVFPGSDTDQASRLFSGTLVTGNMCTDGVVVDEATADALKLDVGGTVVVTWAPVEGENREARAPVCGIGRPWHPGGSVGGRGYLIASRGFVSHAIPGLRGTKQETTYWLDDAQAGATSKWESTMGVFGEDVAASAFVLVVAVIGFVLWWVGLQRTTSGLRQRLAPVISVLRSLGAPVAGWLWLYSGLLASMALVAAIVAGVVARLVITSWTALYISSDQILVVTVALLGVALVAMLFFGRRMSRSW